MDGDAGSCGGGGETVQSRVGQDRECPGEGGTGDLIGVDACELPDVLASFAGGVSTLERALHHRFEGRSGVERV